MTEASIHEYEIALRHAMLHGDIHELDRLIDGTLIFTTHTGEVVDKKNDLDTHRSGLLKLTSMDPSNERIQIYGTTAVVSVRMELTGTYDGAFFAGIFQYTRIWLERPDGCRVIAGHAVVASPG
jgi:hypothetical protein